MTRLKKLGVLLFITLVGLVAFNLIHTSKAFAAEEPVSDANRGMAITVHLTGTVPTTGVTVQVIRPSYSGEPSAYAAKITVDELNSTTYGANDMTPFASGTPSCDQIHSEATGNPPQQQAIDILTFEVKVVDKSTGKTLATSPAKQYTCGQNDVSVALTGSTSTPTATQINLTGTVYVCVGGDANSTETGCTSGSAQKAQDYTSAGGTTDDDALTLNPTGMISGLTNGGYKFPDITSGKYSVSGIVGVHGLQQGFNFCDIVINVTATQHTRDIYITQGSGNETSDACTGTNGTQVGTATATTPTTSCVSTGGPFSWFICMSLHTLGAVEDSIIGIVQSLLKTNPVDFSEPAYCSDPTSGQYASCTSNQKISATIYSVWSQFRIYGDTLLVIAVLVAIIIEAAGGGSIAEAYTVKRMLPRILVAAILINLSIYIIAGAEDIINVLGGGIQNLMLAPFNGISGAPSGAPPVNGVASTIHVSGSAGVLATLGLGGIAVVAGFTEGIAGIALFVLGSFVLAALGVLITIMIRQGLLVILLLTSPIAFALYCLPNTEQYFRKWWDLFIKTLVVYPIVMIVIAASSIAALIFSNFGLASPLNTLIAIFAAGAPLFLIPFAFKLSGGAIGQVHGAISGITDRGKQATNNMRQNNRKDRGERARNGQLFRGNSRLAKFNSGLAQGAMLAPKAGLNPTRWRAKMHEARGGQSFTQAQELMQNNHEFAGMAQDDTMLQATRALAAGDGAEARRILRADGLGRFNTQRELENGIAQAESVQRAGGSRAVQVATTMALAGINTGFEGRTDSHGNAIDTSKAMMAEIAEASGGDAVLANQMMGRMKGMATQAGRLEEGGASFGAMSGELRHALGARAAGGTYDQIAGAVDSHALNLDALVNNDSVTVVRSQTNSVSSLMGSAQQRLNELDTRQRSGAVLTVDEQAERGRLVSIVENTHTTGSMYAAPSRVTQTQQALDNTTRARSQIRLEVPVAPVRVPNPAPPTPPIASAAPVAPGAPAHPPAGPAAGPPAPPPPLYEMREIGENVDIHTGGLVPPGSAESQVPPQVRGLNEQRQRRAYNPNDPNAQDP